MRGQTSEIRTLDSVHAADARFGIIPMHCRGRVDGGKFRGYRISAFADVPRTVLQFADTFDSLGPAGAKSMSESPSNTLAAALGNAILDATGVRPQATPFKADRISQRVIDQSNGSLGQ